MVAAAAAAAAAVAAVGSVGDTCITSTSYKCFIRLHPFLKRNVQKCDLTMIS